MKLYYSKGACSLTVRIIINELGLASDYESVNLSAKQTETGTDFLSVNPKGAVPTLVIEQNKILTENAVILQYLADSQQATELLPPVTDFNRYRVLEWLNYVSTEMHKGAGILFNPRVPQTVKDELFIPLLKAKLNYLAAHLAKQAYLAGDHFTLPDAYLFVVLNWLQVFKIDLHEWPALSAYFATIKNRAAVKKSLQEEGLH